jgi:hypothetical protein
MRRIPLIGSYRSNAYTMDSDTALTEVINGNKVRQVGTLQLLMLIYTTISIFCELDR